MWYLCYFEDSSRYNAVPVEGNRDIDAATVFFNLHASDKDEERNVVVADSIGTVRLFEVRPAFAKHVHREPY